MSRQIDYPPNKRLKAMVLEHGATGAADRLGLKVATLREHLKREGLPTRRAPRQVEEREIPVDDPDKVKIDQLEAENKELTKRCNDYAGKMASQEAFLERCVEVMRRPVAAPKLRRKSQGKGLPHRAAIAPVFDIQYGQLVQPEDTPGGRGAYSTEIFDRRLARWFDGITGAIRLYAANHRITDLVVPLGGDFVEGHEIFAGQAWQLEVDPARQLWEFTEKFDATLRELIAFAKQEIGIPRIRLYGVPGNHGKVGGKKAGATHTTHSWDWLCLMLLRDKLRAQPIKEFAIEPAGVLYFEAAEHLFLMIHGDEIKGWGGLPFYGLSRYDGKAIRQGQQIHDYLILGDKHVPAELDQGGGGETLMQPAWVGENNLSRQLGAAARPGQRLYFVAPKWGVTETARIHFEEATVQRAPSTVHT